MGLEAWVEDLHSSYYILRFNCERQATLQNTELRMGTNIAGALTTYVGYRRRSPNLIDQNQDAILWSIQINAPRFMFSIGYDYTVSSLNIQRTRYHRSRTHHSIWCEGVYTEEEHLNHVM